MKLVVTGAGGYIGRHVSKLLESQGHEVVHATRRAVPNAAWVHFDLEDAAPVALPAGTDAVLHLAARTTSGDSDESVRVQLRAALALLGEARRVGARFVFVSSQTARADAPTLYGRTKWLIEQEVLGNAGTVVRPGQVYGGEAGGLFGTLLTLVERCPVLPAFLPAPRVQPVHVDDLAHALGSVLVRSDLGSRVLHIGAHESLAFTAFLRAIAHHRVRRPRAFIPVPSVLVAFARTMSFGRIAPIERLSSLFRLPLMATQADLELLGLRLRPLEHGMTRSGRASRRELLAESAATLRYVLGERPGNALTRRHVRALEQLRQGRPAGLPAWVVGMPFLMPLLESTEAVELQWRLDCACALAEATPQGARRFLGARAASQPLGAALGLGAALAREAFWRTVRPVFAILPQRRKTL